MPTPDTNTQKRTIYMKILCSFPSLIWTGASFINNKRLQNTIHLVCTLSASFDYFTNWLLCVYHRRRRRRRRRQWPTLVSTLNEMCMKKTICYLKTKNIEIKLERTCDEWTEATKGVNGIICLCGTRRQWAAAAVGGFVRNWSLLMLPF